MRLQAKKLRLSGALEILPGRYGDERGFFSEVYNRRSYRDIGIDVDWVQDNHSLSRRPGVIRGLHFQIPPFAQDKLVRVTRGRILDVILDIRHGSETFGEWLSLELSSEAWNQLFVPKGFAHGFCTMEPDSEVLYKVSNYYSADHERTIRYDDPELGIDWRLGQEVPVVSDKDRDAPAFRDLERYF